MTVPSFRDLFRFPFRPVALIGPEGLLMRLSFAILVNLMMPTVLDKARLDAPTGLAHLMDLSWVANPGVLTWIRLAIGLLSVAYVFAQGLSVVLPLLAVLHVVVFTYFNSQGFTHHGNQIISLILVAQAFVALFFPIYRAIAGRPWVPREGKSRDSYFLWYSQIVIAGVYMTSVVSKMDESNGRWIQKLPNISVQLIKTHRQEFYTNPAKSTIARDAEVPSAKWMIENPNLTRLFLGAGLALEFFVFLALANRGWAILIGISIWVMHFLIGWLMRLYFDLNGWAALIFFINIPFWVLWGMAKNRRLARWT